MKHLDLLFYILAASVPFICFVVGFSFGQRSAKFVPLRTETLKVSERLTVERTLPEPEAKAIPVTRETSEDEVGVPPQYRSLLKEHRARQGVDS